MDGLDVGRGAEGEGKLNSRARHVDYLVLPRKGNLKLGEYRCIKAAGGCKYVRAKIRRKGRLKMRVGCNWLDVKTELPQQIGLASFRLFDYRWIYLGGLGKLLCG